MRHNLLALFFALAVIASTSVAAAAENAPGKKLVQLAKAPSAKSPAGANLQCGSYFEAYFYGDQEHLRSPGTVVTPDDKIAYMTEGGGWASVLRSNVIVIKAPGGKKMVPTVEESGTGDDRKAIVHVSPERHAETGGCLPDFQ